jgi:signal transduction histidine kinase
MLPSAELVHAGSVPTPASLAQAFVVFNAAAGALEHSYQELQQEVLRLAKQLAAAQQELEGERQAARRAQALDQMARVLAHELRNPLASMELFAALLAGSNLRQEQRRWVQGLQAGIRLLGATVTNVLQFSATEIADLVPVALGELVRSTTEFLQPVAAQARVEIMFQDRCPGARIAADPPRLQQVLLNLALNAVRAMEQGGELRFTSTSIGNNRVELAIADTGPGIAPEHRAKIFDPGFTTRPGRAGLGLAVCKRILQQHNAEIRLRSTETGCCFVLTLESL